MLESDIHPQHRTWGMTCHLAALSGYLVPFGHILGPLVVWLFKGQDHPFVDAQGKESLNFQISMTIYMAVSYLLVFVIIGFVLLGALALLDLIFIIVASVKSRSGQTYRYPFTIRLIK